MSAGRSMRWLGPFVRGALLVALSLAAAGCPGPAKRSHDAPAAVSVAAGETYRHAGSGVEFPPDAAGFIRERVTRYDAAGDNVSGSYNLDDLLPRLATTVYVYPGAQVISIGSPREGVMAARTHVLESHFARVQADVMSAHPQARLVSSGAIDAPSAGGTAAAQGRRAVYVLPDGKVSIAYLFVRDNKWFIKCRITARPGLSAEDVEADTRRLLAALKLPG